MPRQRRRSAQPAQAGAQLSNRETTTTTPVQGKWWFLTIPTASWQPHLPDACDYIKGQREIPPDGYDHWQVVAHFKERVRFTPAKAAFTTDTHIEISKFKSALEYVWKEDTRVAGTQFEFGKQPFHANSKVDWEEQKRLILSGELDKLSPRVFVCNYGAIKKIMADYMKPVEQVKEVQIFWGATGLGKSRKAWELAGINAYPKIQTTKWWDGYRPEEHENVVIDEFTGSIDITHMLRWCDRYPCIVETKGSSAVFKAKRIFITSNLDPQFWWPLAIEEQRAAFERRVTITHVTEDLYAN